MESEQIHQSERLKILCGDIIIKLIYNMLEFKFYQYILSLIYFKFINIPYNGK